MADEQIKRFRVIENLGRLDRVIRIVLGVSYGCYTLDDYHHECLST